MSYTTQYRKRTIEYRQEGHTLEETSRVFKVSVGTIRDWERRLKESGSLEKSELNRPQKKVDLQKLESYLAQHPDAYQTEIAREFGCTPRAIRKAFKKLGVTRKKRPSDIENSAPTK